MDMRERHPCPARRRPFTGALRWLLAALVALALQAGAGPDGNGGPLTLSRLAKDADLVALARVADTDYVYTRDFPSEGSAYLRILIPYKPGDLQQDLVEVYEKGLHAHECYFENPTVFEEGRRYLVFFRRATGDPETYRGLDEGCALEVLVAADNRYALRLPLDGFDLDPAIAEYGAEFEFRDRYAVLEEDAISPDRRNELLEQGLLKRHGDGYKYTRGIDLTTARKLLDLEPQ
jgi:hypothetical protein